MSRKNKLHKFAELLSFPNVYECYDIRKQELVGVDMEPVDLRGKWNAVHFKNDRPITVELACGAGEYTVGLARKFPDRNFIGVDIKGNRMWVGAREALDAGLTNAAFIRTRIEILDQFFGPGEIDEIWITFPDPFPQAIKENRRLTSDFFHNHYRNMLRPGGLVHLKHDDNGFYTFTLKTITHDPSCRILYQNNDIYAGILPLPELAIQTRYEGMHLANGKTIKYVRYTIS